MGIHISDGVYQIEISATHDELSAHVGSVVEFKTTTSSIKGKVTGFFGKFNHAKEKRRRETFLLVDVNVGNQDKLKGEEVKLTRFLPSKRVRKHANS